MSLQKGTTLNKPKQIQSYLELITQASKISLTTGSNPKSGVKSG
jgi:hypothetical protein